MEDVFMMSIVFYNFALVTDVQRGQDKGVQ